MNFLVTAANFISQLIGTLVETIGKLASWLVVFMVLVTFGIVVMRYVFNTGSIQVQESVLYMHATLFLLAAASTLKQDGHVRVDIFYGKMSVKRKAVVDTLGNLLLLIPVCAFIFWSSWEYVADAWEIQETSREAGGLPGVYLVKTLILVFSSLLILQSIAEILKNIRTLFSPSDNNPPSTVNLSD